MVCGGLEYLCGDLATSLGTRASLDRSQLNFYMDVEVLEAAQVLRTCPCSSSVKLFGSLTPSSESCFSAHTIKEDKEIHI